MQAWGWGRRSVAVAGVLPFPLLTQRNAATIAPNVSRQDRRTALFCEVDVKFSKSLLASFEHQERC